MESHTNARLLAQACIGVLFGSLIALLIARLFIPLTGSVKNSDILPWAMANVLDKPREKTFYLLTLMLGFFFASISVRQLWSLSLSLLLVFLLIAVPLVNLIAKTMLSSNRSWIFLLVNLLIMLLAWSVLRKKNPSMSMPLNNNFHLHWKPFLIPATIITLIIAPSSIQAIAAKIGMEMHVVSFVIGPALYFFGSHLVPYLDYFTQYSIGMGYVFSYFMGNTAETTIIHYTVFVLVALWLFYIQLTYVLAWLYRSWFAASVTAILSLILLFHTTRHFHDPSSSILRYPLLGVCAWMISRWIKKPSQLASVILAAILALSIFLNTETGFIMCAAFAISTLLTSRKPLSTLLPILSIGVYTLGIFLMMLAILFGREVLSLAFLNAFIKPLIIYGRIGFSGWLINWSLKDLNWFYNIVTPGIALATLALIPILSRNTRDDQPRLAVLAFFTTAGLFMMAKFINMSIISVWQMNALGLLIPIGWWIVWFAKEYQLDVIRLPRMQPMPVDCAIFGIATICALYIATHTHDRRNESEYAFRSWIRYPSLITAVFRHHENVCRSMSCVENRPADSDIALITARTSPGEQVAIIGPYDWTYLIGAKRPPLMAFLPSNDIFTRDQLQQTLARLDSAPYLFLPKGSNHEPQIDGPLHDILLPDLHKQFVYDGEGEKLIAYKRVHVRDTDL